MCVGYLLTYMLDGRASFSRSKDFSRSEFVYVRACVCMYLCVHVCVYICICYVIITN